MDNSHGCLYSEGRGEILNQDQILVSPLTETTSKRGSNSGHLERRMPLKQRYVLRIQ